MLIKKRVIVDIIKSKEKLANSHKRILYPHIEDKNAKFTDKENYSYWKGYERALIEIYQDLDF